MPSEFDLIRQHFTRPTPSAILGIGDDAALVQVTPGMELAVSVDMLVEGRHFSPQDGPGTVGFKSLAVNLSDMAAMGARPRWVTLALALPAADEKWLRGFAGGFFGLAKQFGVELIGGDTTRGPLNICVQIMGEVPPGQALRRDGAKVGDEIWVSGTLGNAALALAHYQRRVELEHLEAAAMLPFLHLPQARVALGLALRGIASAAIDISDGLLADLGHILEQSGVGAEIHFEDLPLHEVMQRHIGLEVAQNCILAGGDDYELCFTAPPSQHETILALAQQLALPLACIGRILGSAGLNVQKEGQAMIINTKGFDHFAS
ncbi:MAG: thiamine-phosphate kinase [Sulfuricellaceae bacterium]|nr:thiamine-phosphate kinase [Sulfuricellaceae bacterium]